MKRLRSAPLLLVTALAACEAAPVTEAERADIVALIEQKAQTFLEAGNQDDATIHHSVMARDGVFIDFNTYLVDADAFVEQSQEIFDRFQSWDAVWEETNVDVLSSDAAVFEGRFTLQRRRNDGQLTEGNTYMTAIFKKIDDEWTMTRGHLSGSGRNVDG